MGEKQCYLTYYGKLVDSTGKAIGDASVILLQNKYDSTLKRIKKFC
jgi:hypothetical protein